MAEPGKLMKFLGKITTDNDDILSKGLVKKTLNGKGALLAVGGMAAYTTADEFRKASNVGKMGSVQYLDGPARMTQSYTTGAVPAMMNASKGNYGVFADMAEEVVKSNSLAGRYLDDYGANDKLISALYNMGGR